MTVDGEPLHLVQLFVDFLVILVVFAKLGDQGPVSQSEQLRVLQDKKQRKSHITEAAQNEVNHAGTTASRDLTDRVRSTVMW